MQLNGKERRRALPCLVHRPTRSFVVRGRRGRPTRDRLPRFDDQSQRGAVLIVDDDIDEGGQTDRVDARLREVIAGNRDRFDRLIRPRPRRSPGLPPGPTRGRHRQSRPPPRSGGNGPIPSRCRCASRPPQRGGWPPRPPRATARWRGVQYSSQNPPDWLAHRAERSPPIRRATHAVSGPFSSSILPWDVRRLVRPSAAPRYRGAAH